MEDQYGMADPRQYVTGRPFFPAISPPPGLPSVHRDFASDNHPYYMLNFRSVSSTSTAPPGVTTIAANTSGGFTAGFETECGGGAGRWPRQETLTLLEIRSGLDPKFKEANQKGPLWDEVSRIMYEEYGYQRSGKKCREKFENLYKYYKKTKVGKAGRQDGKHYRFFRQLEALYGDQTTNNNNNNSSASISETNFVGANNFQYDFPKNTNPLPNNNNINNQESHTSLISTTNSSEFDTIIASDDDSERNVLEVDTNNDPKRKKKMEKRSLKAKIKDSIDAQMKRMMEKQEAWMEKMMRTIEENEKERISREEQWRKQDDERIRGEQKLWASEKAWIQARDAALMDAFGKLAGNGLRVSSQEELIGHEGGGDGWEENVGTKMACFRQDDHMSDYLIKCSKKIKDNSRMIGVYHDHRTHESISDRQGIDRGNWPHDDQDDVNGNSCIRYFNGDACGRIMN